MRDTLMRVACVLPVVARPMHHHGIEWRPWRLLDKIATKLGVRLAGFSGEGQRPFLPHPFAFNDVGSPESEPFEGTLVIASLAAEYDRPET